MAAASDRRSTRRQRFSDPLPQYLREHGHVRESFGLTAGEQLEVVAQVSYTMFANLVANLADTRLDDAFAPQAWDVPATLGASG